MNFITTLHRRHPRMALSVITLALTATGANAQTTIFDTTGGNTSFTYPSYNIGPDPYFALALGFSVTSASNLSSINLFLNWTDASVYTIQLTNAGIGQPGLLLDSWTSFGSASEITLTPNATDLLAAGNYDVVVSTYGENGDWSLNNNVLGSFESVWPDLN